jgi:hypothetical protein
MTTFELLDFTEAKEQVKVGRFSEALPKLYRLAAIYPENTEIQNLIKQCLLNPPTPSKALNKFTFRDSWFALIIMSIIIIIGLASYFNQPGNADFTYKEYSSIAQVYQKAALGEKVKVTITTYEPTPTGTGTIKLYDDGSSGVIIRIPASLKDKIKFLPGRNIVYGLISERSQSVIFLDVEKVQY